MKKCYLFLFFLLFSALCSAIDNERVLSIGSISNTPKEEVASFQPFIDYLVAALNHPKIKTGRVVVAASLNEMSNLINQGEVDLYIDSPFPILAIKATTASVPFLRGWKKGISQYSSVIFVRKDSDIESLNDLKGHMLAFEEPFSTSGYFLPKALMLNHELPLVERFKKQDSVPKGKVGFVFSFDDETTMVWVLRKKVAAGALNKNSYRLLAKSKLNELKILKETIKVPRQVLAHRPGLAPALRNQITAILLNMAKNARGKQVLKGFANTTKFEPLDIGELDGIAKLYQLIDRHLDLSQ